MLLNVNSERIALVGSQKRLTEYLGVTTTEAPAQKLPRAAYMSALVWNSGKKTKPRSSGVSARY